MKYFISLIALLLIIGCSDTEPTLDSSCKGITCSDHGKCIEKGGTPTCECDAEYLSIGNECVFNCSSITNAITNFYNNGCDCEAGYIEVLTTEGVLTECKISQNVNCEDGYIFNNGRCEFDCSAEKYSHVNESNNGCICNTGYVNIHEHCVIDCGYVANSHPNTTNDSCDCDEGYVKDNEVCILQCNTTGNMHADGWVCVCNEDYYISNEPNICLNPCEDVECIDNSICEGQSFNTFYCGCNPERSFKAYTNKRITTNEDHDFEPVIHFNGTQYAIVWQKLSNEDGKYNIFMTILNKNKEVTVAPFMVNDISANDKMNPSIAWNGTEYAIVWVDNRNNLDDTEDNINTNLYLKRINASGIKVASDIQVTNDLDDSSLPRIVWNEEHSIYTIFWIQYNRGIAQTLNMKSYSPDGTPINEIPFSVEDTELIINKFDVTIGKNNEYAVVYNIDEHGSKVYFTDISKDGVISVPARKITYENSAAYNPKISYNDEKYNIVWLDVRNGGRTPYFTKLNESGEKINFEYQVSYSNSYSDNYGFIWTGYEYLIYLSAGAEVYTSRLNNMGYATFADMRLTYTASKAQFPSMVFADGVYGLVWSDIRDGNWELYFDTVGCY